MKLKYSSIKIFLLYILFVSLADAACKHCGNDPELKANVKVLLQVPEDKATVGVIPYYTHNKQIYLLLARERLDGKKVNAAGKFSDFGGSVVLDGSTFAQNALRELKEESMGQIVISEDDLLNKSLMLYKTNNIGRVIIYLLYPFTEEQYLQTKSFNDLRVKLSALSRTPSSYLEKDKFYWFRFKDVFEHISRVKDIDGQDHEIQLRDFFVQDFIMHHDLPKAIENISPNN